MIVLRKICLALLFLCSLPSCGATTSKAVAPAGPIPRTFFGLHIHRAVGKTSWPDMPVSTVRLWDAHVAWPDVEPQKGHWRFDTLDKNIALAAQHNAEILLTLALTPQWASARPNEKSDWQKPGYAAEPKDMNDWRTYVRQVVTRYKGRIAAYEIWNEPNSKLYFTGSAEKMVELSREAYSIIKEIDPSATVVSSSVDKGWGLPWLVDFLHKGGGRYADAIGYHFYVYPQPPEAMLPLIAKVKQAMKDNGVGDKPLWDTEAGWAEPKPFPSSDLAAGYLARAFVLNWVAGVQRFYWYAWDNHTWVSLETVEADDKTPTPAGQAYGTIQTWMVGASMDGCDESDDGTWTCHLHRGNDSQWIVWNADTTKSFNVPASWHITRIAFLLQGTQELHDTSIEVGPIPELLIQGDLPAAPTSLSASPRQ